MEVSATDSFDGLLGSRRGRGFEASNLELERQVELLWTSAEDGPQSTPAAQLVRRLTGNVRRGDGSLALHALNYGGTHSLYSSEVVEGTHVAQLLQALIARALRKADERDRDLVRAFITHIPSTATAGRITNAAYARTSEKLTASALRMLGAGELDLGELERRAESEWRAFAVEACARRAFSHGDKLLVRLGLGGRGRGTMATWKAALEAWFEAGKLTAAEQAIRAELNSRLRASGAPRQQAVGRRSDRRPH